MPDPAEVVELFRSIPLFRGLEDKELKTRAVSSKEKAFQAGEQIVKTGEAGLGFYVIMSGHAVVRKGDRTVAELGRGDFFGEMALLDEQPRSADVVAKDATKCMVLLRWNFWSLVTKNPNVVRGLLKEMARRLREANKALTE